MKTKELRFWFTPGCLALILAAATPTFALLIRIRSDSNSFSELWLLGSNHKAYDYPFNIGSNETYSIYVGVGNHIGYSAYYRIFVKLRNQTQLLPTSSNLTHSEALPSPLPTLYEFNFFVRRDETWEAPLDFRIMKKETFNNSMILRSLSVNEITFWIDVISVWDVERNGFYYQLFFELWLYNIKSQSFEYNNRFVGMWLNLTI